MRSPNPAAEFAELLFVRRRNPFRDGKLFPRIASVTLLPGDQSQREAIVRGSEIQSIGTTGLQRRIVPDRPAAAAALFGLPVRRLSTRASTSSFRSICAPHTDAASRDDEERRREARTRLPVPRAQHKSGRKLYIEMTFALVIVGATGRLRTRAMLLNASKPSGKAGGG